MPMPNATSQELLTLTLQTSKKFTFVSFLFLALPRSLWDLSSQPGIELRTLQ